MSAMYDFVCAAVEYADKERCQELLNIAFNDGLVDTFDMARLLWKYKVSSWHIPGFNLIEIVQRKDIDSIENDLQVDYEIASRMSYASTRSYINQDDMIEIMHGMHKDVLKGEVESNILS